MQMRPSLALAALSTTVLASALAAAPAHAEPLTCQGRAVTVTGDAGTSGDDVMVVGPGQKSVSTGAGNDLVCIRLADGDPVRRYLFLDTGAGDDVVLNETTASVRTVSVVLGTGADTFTGSDVTSEAVSTGPDLWGGTGDTERDVVDSRGGNDVVSSGSVAPGTPNPDVIATGAGDDSIDWAGVQTGGSLDLGAGENRMRLRSGWVGDDVVIDAPQGLVTAGAIPVLRWTGDVTAYGLEHAHLRTTFTGTDLDEYVTFWPSQSSSPDSVVAHPGLRLDANMGGGDDRLEMFDAAGGSWVGGPGEDRLGGPRCLGADVRLGRTYACTGDHPKGTAYSAGIDVRERLSVAGSRLRVVGSAGPDRIEVFGTPVRLDGRGGDDRLTASASAGAGRNAKPAVVRGGAGDDTIRGGHLRDRLIGGPGRDRMWGGRGDDVLVGGAGRDQARGGAGRDRCTAEVRRSCERR